MKEGGHRVSNGINGVNEPCAGVPGGLPINNRACSRVPIRSFRDLIAWQKSMALCKEVYRLSAFFPKAEQYGLTAQVRRAAVSIPSNIAEGYQRRRTGDYLRFLDIARGSLAEVETQMILGHELCFLPPSAYEEIDPSIREVDRILFALVRSIEGAASQ